MDRIHKIYEAHGEWPQAIDLAESGYSANDLFNQDLINLTLNLARENPRKRAIIRVHQKAADERHLLVNAILGESYVQPHKHAAKEKTETFRIIKGEAYVLLFDDLGEVKNAIKLSDTPDGRKLATIRLSAWHSLVPLSEETVVLEASREADSGYDPATDKTFARWAPEQKDAQAGLRYLHGILANLDTASK